MARIIVVTSGKGGVGKTTSSASFASGLAMRGHKTAVIDFDVGLRNLDLIMGCERRVVYDLINVVNGEATLNQALIKDKHCDNLFVLPASQTRDKDALSEEGVERVLKDLADMGFEYIICDSPAGIERGAVMALTFADEAVIVTNPEVSSVRDSDRILGIIQAKSRRAQNGGIPVKEHPKEKIPAVTLQRTRANQCANVLHRRVIGLSAFELAFALDTLAQVIDRGNDHRIDFVQFRHFGWMVHGGLTSRPCSALQGQVELMECSVDQSISK